MPSTTVHFPDKILGRIDRFVKNENISRNKFIIQACTKALNNASTWPKNFFKCKLKEEDLKLLRESSKEIETTIISRRVNRKGIEL